MNRLFDRFGWWLLTVIAVVSMLILMIQEFQKVNNMDRKLRWYENPMNRMIAAMVLMVAGGWILYLLDLRDEPNWWWLLWILPAAYIVINALLLTFHGFKNFSKTWKPRK